MTVETVYLVIGIIVGLAAIGGILFAGWVLLVRPLQTLTGRKASPGVQALPSLLDRLDDEASQRKQLAINLTDYRSTTVASLEEIKKQTVPNGGNAATTADAIVRIERAVADTNTKIDVQTQLLGAHLTGHQSAVTTT
jgi:hypothetical protein